MNELMRLVETSFESSASQGDRAHMLMTSFRVLFLRKQAIETVYLQFPWGTDHELIQAAGIDCLEAFFQGYYATLSHFVAFVRAIPNTFGSSELPHRSTAAFLREWAQRFPEMQEVVNCVETAREHRAFLDHAPGLPAYGLWTGSSSETQEMTVTYYGDLGGSGIAPAGTRTIPYFIESQWHKPTPDYREAFLAMELLIGNALRKIVNQHGPERIACEPGAHINFVQTKMAPLLFGEFPVGTIAPDGPAPADRGRVIRAVEDGVASIPRNPGPWTY